jgi:4-amino-4-deoxy-L-arabinose transferase-like glycosyltransferase
VGSGVGAATALALAAGALLAVRLDVPAFFDNEGRYAEVAREMVLRGDYLTPHLDFVPFLNKPPLVFWLTAAVFRAAGPTEWARLVPIGAAMVALVATCRLGALLWGARTGLVAGVMLATSLGFVLEARTLRPDLVLTAVVVVALLCWRRAVTGVRRRTPWLVGMYAALALGMLAKGPIVLIAPLLTITVVTADESGWRGLAALRPGLGLVVAGTIVLPWHVLAALANPGFAWDYTVNQHLLFLVGRKLPRDSEGDALVFFWGAFAGRAFPWVLLVPLALAEGVRGLRTRAGDARGTALVWVWLGIVLLFFSATGSRLEHYSLPALPGMALLAARGWQHAGAGTFGGWPWAWLAAVGVLLVLAGGVLAAAGPALLADVYWIAQAPALLALPIPAGAASVVGGGTMLVAALGRLPRLVPAALALVAVPLAAIVVRAEVAVEPLFSWRPAAEAIRSLPPETEIVFEAPIEYQQVGGLAFYTGRRIALLEPPGFVPQTYLVPLLADMFLSPADLARRWGSAERLVFVSDPQQRRDRPDGLVPGPFHVVARFGDRWVLANFAPR